MPLFDRDIVTPYNSLAAGVIPNPVFGVALNYYPDRWPIMSQFPMLPVGSVQFLLTKENYRPNSFVTGSAFTDTTGTSLTSPDGTQHLVGDIIEVEDEQMQITAISGNTLTVTRGWGGSTAATHLISKTAYVIGNTRTGGEVDQQAISLIPNPVTQYCQTIQVPYQMGGSLATTDNYVSPYKSPLDRDRDLAMRTCGDSYETSCYYGRGQAFTAAGTRQQMKGMRFLMSTNKNTNPTNKTAYKVTDFIRDVIQAPFSNGGKIDTVLVSLDYMNAFALWTNNTFNIRVGETELGAKIERIQVAFLNGAEIIVAPLLRPGTAVGLTSEEVRNRIKRQMDDKPRGSRGDAIEGDFIMEGALELDNEAHHSWVEGVTAFA